MVFNCVEVSAMISVRLLRRSSCERLVSARKSRIFCIWASRTGLTLAFWSSVRLSVFASISRFGAPRIPGGRCAAGGVLVESCALTETFNASRPPAAIAAMRNILCAFITEFIAFVIGFARFL